MVAAGKGGCGTSEAGQIERLAEVIAAPTALMAASPAYATRPCWASRLFMVSAAISPSALTISRSRWEIENRLRWMLDVNPAEDVSRATTKDNARANTAHQPGINRGAWSDDVVAVHSHVYVINGKLSSRRLLNSCRTPGIAASSKSKWFINADFTTSGVLPN
ncbi:hypothetical protein PYH37_006199 (plasmid) [Sinorhizobium numidicum]|uniref:Transposase n=1 Tax=Sinorhizobium numidicum TaxID=680248 RepID=A0ABY8D4E0_9HYPH|nr:hypothetical protein [Sinorhizobium numidicum]WEX79745.1 hypothetical protein PYH37_006199 [Sinorhizobium numidicum]WEX85726.1 hypothetical protein PYH38_006185 [Sinorhizobium numidicum]